MLILVAVIAIAFGIVMYAVRTLNSIQRVVMDAYRVWGTGSLLVDYMNANGQRWPTDWEQLETFYTGSNRTYTIIETFRDIKDHIEIDFAFDPTTVTFENDEDDPPFRVVWLRNGTDSRYVGAGPNQIVYAHLKRRDATANSRAADHAGQAEAQNLRTPTEANRQESANRTTASEELLTP